jgi:predicted ATP-dependent endonuclease of OLD family
VLLTITRLVETVEERTLVLLDEPEAHLHPPLLSAFVRSLSDLLINRNGVAIRR